MTKNKYEITVEILLERKQQLLKELEGIDYTIASLNAMSPISNTTYKSEETKIKDVKLKKNILGYDSNNGVAAKFVFFLKKEQRFLHLREVAEMIIEADGSNEDVTEFARKMSSSLQSLKKKKYIIKYQYGKQNRNTFWGVQKWLNSDGSIKNGHEFNKDYISQGSEKPKSEDLFKDFE